MIRCPSCGSRLADGEAACVAHGRPPAAASQPAAEDDPGDEQDLWSEETARVVREALAAEGLEASELLGRGGFGVVLAGRRVSDAAPVAIKVGLVDGAEARAEMRREADATRQAQGPHVPEMVWLGDASGHPAMAMRRVTDPTLASLLDQRAGEPLELERCRRIIAGLLDAVAAVHQAGLVHLDLKPENTFVRDDGHVTLIDFGLARSLGQVRREPDEETGEPVGTAEYMSPEHCDDAPDLDQRADVYSTAVLIYEMLSGAPPFWGKEPDVREAQRSRRAKPLPPRIGLPRSVDAVVRGALSKDRARRPASIAALRDELMQALSSSDASLAPPAGAQPKPARAGRPKPRARSNAGTKEKQNLGLLFFESSAGINDLRPTLAAASGDIVQAKDTQYIVAFGHDSSENPAKPALSLAHRLVAEKLTRAVLLDVAPVTVSVRPDGGRRYSGVVLTKKDRMPTGEDPEGVTFTRAAVDVLGDLAFSAVEGREGRFVLDHAKSATPDQTTFGTRNTPIIGRADLVSKVLAGLRNAFQASVPTIFSIEGKAGYGKTHLAGTVAEHVESLFPQAMVLRLAGEQSVLGSRGRVLPTMLRRLLELPDHVEEGGAQQLFESRFGAEIGAQVWPAAAFSMGYITADHPEIDRLAAAPGALRKATSRALGEAVRLRARQGPLCLVLDDAHLADESVLDGLEYATLGELQAPIFACVFVPDGFSAEHAGFAARAGARASEHLEALEEPHAAELARVLLHPVEYVPPGVLAKLLQRTQRVPRLLVELVRGLKREGIVRQNEAGTGYYVATDELDKLPDLPIVQWNAQREVRALPPQLAGHAKLASILGAEFTLDELERLISTLERQQTAEDETTLDPAVGVARLVASRILHQHSAGHLSFRYPLLRETIYETVPAARRKVLHQAALEVYESSEHLARDYRVPRIALHAARCGQKDKAVEAYLSLGQTLLEAQAYLPAEAAFGCALENLSGDSDEGTLRAAHGRGLMRFRLGRHDDALKDLKLARRCAHELGRVVAEAELMLDEATVLDWRLKIAESAELVAAARQLLSDPPPLLAARLRGNEARVHFRAGESEQCIEAGLQATEQAAQLGDAGYETLIIALLMVAPDCCKLGRLDEAERLFDNAIQQARAHSDEHHLAAAYVNRVFLWFALSRTNRMVEDLQLSTRIAREIGEPFIEYVASGNLAEVLYWTADGPALSRGRSDSAAPMNTTSEDTTLQRASEHAKRGVDLARQLWGTSAEVIRNQLLLARISFYRQDAAACSAMLSSIRDALQSSEVGDDPRWGSAERALLEALELSVSPGARDAWRALTSRVEEDGLEPQEVLEIHELHARALLGGGHPDEARTIYEKAVGLAREHENLMSARVLGNFEREFGAENALASG